MLHIGDNYYLYLWIINSLCEGFQMGCVNLNVLDWFNYLNSFRGDQRTEPKSMFCLRPYLSESNIIHCTKLCLPAIQQERNFYKFIKYQKYLHINWSHNSLRKSRLFYMKIYRSLKHVFAYTSEHINYFMKIFTFFLCWCYFSRILF